AGVGAELPFGYRRPFGKGRKCNSREQREHERAVHFHRGILLNHSQESPGASQMRDHRRKSWKAARMTTGVKSNAAIGDRQSKSTWTGRPGVRVVQYNALFRFLA